MVRPAWHHYRYEQSDLGQTAQKEHTPDLTALAIAFSVSCHHYYEWVLLDCDLARSQEHVVG